MWSVVSVTIMHIGHLPLIQKNIFIFQNGYEIFKKGKILHIQLIIFNGKYF